MIKSPGTDLWSHPSPFRRCWLPRITAPSNKVRSEQGTWKRLQCVPPDESTRKLQGAFLWKRMFVRRLLTNSTLSLTRTALPMKNSEDATCPTRYRRLRDIKHLPRECDTSSRQREQAVNSVYTGRPPDTLEEYIGVNGPGYRRLPTRGVAMPRVFYL